MQLVWLLEHNCGNISVSTIESFVDRQGLHFAWRSLDHGFILALSRRWMFMCPPKACAVEKPLIRLAMAKIFIRSIWSRNFFDFRRIQIIFSLIFNYLHHNCNYYSITQTMLLIILMRWMRKDANIQN